MDASGETASNLREASEGRGLGHACPLLALFHKKLLVVLESTTKVCYLPMVNSEGPESRTGLAVGSSLRDSV